MTPFIFIVAVLASYRISHMIAREDGPFDVLSTIRGHIDPQQKTWIGRGLSCPLCISFWVTLIVALLIGGTWLEWLGMAGAMIPLNKWVVNR
jgi:hypothetical protein